jgi:hypothetical protein
MTNISLNKSILMDIITENNISIEFLQSSLGNDFYHNSEFNYDNLFYRFYSVDRLPFENYFQLLQFSEDELIIVFGETTIIKLRTFLEKNNCFFNMFEDFTMEDFVALTNFKTRVEDLNPEEKTLSLVLIKCLVDKYANDMDLGKEIRKIFNEIQS